MMAPRGAAVILIVALLAAGGAYYVYSAGSSQVPGASNSLEVNIRIVGGPNGNLTHDTYSPENFSVKEGQNVTLVILNTGNETHALVITQFGVNSGTIPPYGTVKVWFIANQIGVFKFYEPVGYCEGENQSVCDSAQHMSGYMTVKPS
jgi:heme/copper-type cytochrome/quinol oxidase subunit 2